MYVYWQPLGTAPLGTFSTLEKTKKEIIGDQMFFSFDDFTWSKELLDRWIFLKQNFCH